MTLRWIWAVGVIGAVVMLVLLLSQRSMPPRLPVERTVLGKVPPSALRDLVDRSKCLLLRTDLNDDGEPELLISFGMQAFGVNLDLQAASVWTDLQGDFVEVPYEIDYPYYASMLAPNLSPLKEVVGRDRAHKRLLLLRRSKSDWVETTIAGSPTTQVYNPHWRDSDGDGYLDAIVTRLKGTSPIHLQLTPQAKWQPAPHRQFSAALPVSFLNSDPQLATEAAQLGLNFWIGDLDGDGASDYLDMEQRALIFKHGKVVRFAPPTADWQQIIPAELDGRPPIELVYLSQQSGQAAEVKVFRLRDKTLVPIAQRNLPMTSPYGYAHDIDKDGKAELIFGGIDSRAPQFAIIGFRWEKGTLHENHTSLISGVPWRDSATCEYIQPKHSLVFAAQVEEGFVRRRREVHTLLATLGKGIVEDTILLSGELVWTGDYDGDGNEEYVLSNPRGGAVAQFRNGAWHVAEIRRDAPLAAATVVQRQGKPQLILVYHDGVIEATQIKQ